MYTLMYQLLFGHIQYKQYIVFIVRAELKRRECNAMGHAFVCIRRPFEF